MTNTIEVKPEIKEEEKFDAKKAFEQMQEQIKAMDAQIKLKEEEIKKTREENKKYMEDYEAMQKKHELLRENIAINEINPNEELIQQANKMGIVEKDLIGLNDEQLKIAEEAVKESLEKEKKLVK